MTNDYKNKLLKYLTGSIQEEGKSNNPYPPEIINKVVDKSQVAAQETGKVLCKDSEGNNNGKYLTWFQNKIYLYDETNTLLHTYTSYSSGTNFDRIELLNVDEKGNVYGIENYYNGQSRLNRIILLNNLSEKTKVGEYQCIFRQSYTIQRSYTISSFISINKSKQSATYLICVTSNFTGTTIDLRAIQLKINVGVANEWTDFSPITTSNGGTTYNFYDPSDNPVINWFISSISSTTLSVTKIKNNGTTLVAVGSASYNNLIGASLGGTSNAYYPVSSDKMYIIINEEKYVSPSSIYRIHFLVYENEEIKAQKIMNGNFVYTDAPVITPNPRVRIDIVNNVPFCSYNIKTLDSDRKATLYYGSFPGACEYDYLFSIEDTTLSYATFTVSNIYNLYYVTVVYHPYNGGSIDYDHYSIQTTKLIYNPNNYNGSSYENKNSLLPSQGVLYDNQGSILFARNLYNYKNINNYSYSVLNVPNNYLNDIEIAEQLLLGKTNSTLIDNSNPITKNVYEDLYINFNNQITMSNHNEDIYIDNLEGSVRLNNSSGEKLDYDDAKATKIRVTYDDDTYYITGASCTIDNNVGTYSIGIHVPNDKNVQSIQIISHDENTIYQTITNLNLENNKYYIITQDVYVV